MPDGRVYLGVLAPSATPGDTDRVSVRHLLHTDPATTPHYGRGQRIDVQTPDGLRAVAVILDIDGLAGATSTTKHHSRIVDALHAAHFTADVGICRPTSP